MRFALTDPGAAPRSSVAIATERSVSFFEELKQRRVFRVGTVYLVVAWIGVQAASIALPAFDAPPWALRVLILLLALGLPLALLLSWAFDVTPEGLRFTQGTVGNKRMASISVGLVALALVWYFQGQPALRGAQAPERSIAVMPFVNMSGNASNDYFSDGLAETTLDMLAQVPDLKVIARTSSFAFKGKPTDIREVGRKLGAAHLLEGSVQQAGDTVRITVQLIRAKDGTHLWSQRYDRKLKDVFEIQDEIATSVVDALAMNLPETTQKRMVQKRTDSVAAYQEYLKGIALMPKRDVTEMREALRHFERAIQLDPKYAHAYVGAHDTIHLLDLYGGIDAASKQESKHYLARALALAPNLGEAHVSNGLYLQNNNQLDAAIAEYRRGLAMSPGYATGWQWLGELHSYNGDFEKALPLQAKARELDPLSPVINGSYLVTLAFSGRMDEALAGMDAAIAEQPDVARNYDDRAYMHQIRGDLVASLRDLRRLGELDPDAYAFRTNRCMTLMDFGALDDAEQCLQPLVARAPDAPLVRGARSRLARLHGDWATAERLVPEGGTYGTQGYLAAIRLRRNDAAGALELYRALIPGILDESRKPYPGEAFDALYAGIALVRTGEEARGRRLMQAALDAVDDRPSAEAVAARSWLQVSAHEALGDRKAALAALQRNVDGGYAQQIAGLDADPLLDDLHKDPAYSRILAPARAMAKAQVEAAREAGLL